MPRQIFLDLEAHLGLGPVASARVLGMSSAGYMHQRGGKRALQKYTRNHIEALLRLSAAQIHCMLQEREKHD